MFNNIGSKIKTLVKVFFWLAVIGGVIGGALVCKMSQSPLGLLVAGAIILVAWLGSFVMYGYGELIDSTQENTYYLKEIYNQLSKSNLNTGSGEQSQGQSDQVMHSWECHKCKALNAGSMSYCENCGTRRP